MRSLEPERAPRAAARPRGYPEPENGGHGEAMTGMAQYANVYMQLFWLGLGFGVLYLVAAPAINKLMHGVK